MRFLLVQALCFAVFGLFKVVLYARKHQQVRTPAPAQNSQPQYKRVPLPPKLRFEILKRDNFTCRYCGRKPPEVVLEIDHIIPVVEGGTNDWGNLITSCFDCNRGKGKSVITG
jgi:5-methylcytosine-specific restriction endonuclease McrA